MRTQRYGANLRRQVVEPEVAAQGSNHQDQVVFAPVGGNFAQKQRASRPAALAQFKPVADRIIVAVAARRVNEPLLSDPRLPLRCWEPRQEILISRLLAPGTSIQVGAVASRI